MPRLMDCDTDTYSIDWPPHRDKPDMTVGSQQRTRYFGKV